jgi:hypothetical protein
VAAQLDRATFRIVGNEQLLEIARRQPASQDLLSSIKGVPRGMIESRGGEIIGAVARGLAVPENALPKFPKAPRWDRDPEFDVRVAALKTVRDAGWTWTPACCARASVSRPWRARTRHRPKIWRTCASSAHGSAVCSARIF